MNDNEFAILIAERDYRATYWIFPTSRKQAEEFVNQPNLWPNGEPDLDRVLEQIAEHRIKPLEPDDTYGHRAEVICWYRRWWTCKTLLNSKAGFFEDVHPGEQARIDWEAEHGPRVTGWDAPPTVEAGLDVPDDVIREVQDILREEIDKEILADIVAKYGTKDA